MMLGVETPIPPDTINSAALKRGAPAADQWLKNKNAGNPFAPPCLKRGPDAEDHLYTRSWYRFSLFGCELPFMHISKEPIILNFFKSTK